jgi:hypothetical protein
LQPACREQGAGCSPAQKASNHPLQVKEHSLRNLLKQTGETEAHLGGHLRLYQIHSATLDSGVFDSGEVLQELARLKAAKGWRIGLSLSGEQRQRQAPGWWRGL